MKILMLMGGGDIGGAKTHILSLALKLSEEYDFKLISFRDGDFPTEAKNLGIDVIVIPNINPIKARAELFKIINTFKPDILHSHGSKANLYGAFSKGKYTIPVISTIHSDYKLDYLGSPHKQYTFGVINAMSLRKLDFYISVADRMKKTLINRNFNPNNIFKIYNGIDFNISPRDVDRYEYFKNLDIEISNDDIICGIAARLTEVKDIPTLLNAFKTASSKNENLKLMIAGDGEDKEMLLKMSTDLGISDKVHFLGWISDISNFFSAIDINILSSISETFPYSILEGILEGCSTICSDVGGMSELIDTDINGYIFKPRDHNLLSNYIYDLSINHKKREHFSNLLYTKAKTYFSLDNTYQTQVKIYQDAIKKFNYNKRNQVTICGAYGKGNAGDDAILRAIVSEMRDIDENIALCVMSRSPLDTKLDYSTNSIFTFNFFQFLNSFRKSKLYINGGGSLIQDITSSRSLYFYLLTLASAKIFGAKVIMYGCGIGPVNGNFNRKLSAKVIDKYVDVITLRDEISKDELKILGVTKPEIIVTADPTMNIVPDIDDLVYKALDDAKVPKNKRYLGLGIRNWAGLSSVTDEIAKAIDYAYEKYDLIPVFLPIEYPSDLSPAQTIANKLHCEHYIIKERQTTETTIGLFSKMDLVLGVRLHSLIFSAGNGVPVIGMSYDIKVDGFLKYIGSDLCVNLKDITADALKPLIDIALTDDYKQKVLSTAKTLKHNELLNIEVAKKLLEKE